MKNKITWNIFIFRKEGYYESKRHCRIYSSTIGVLLVALNNGFHQIIPSILVWFVQITVTLMFIRMAIAKNSTLEMIKKS